MRVHLWTNPLFCFRDTSEPLLIAAWAIRGLKGFIIIIIIIMPWVYIGLCVRHSPPSRSSPNCDPMLAKLYPFTLSRFPLRTMVMTMVMTTKECVLLSGFEPPYLPSNVSWGVGVAS